MEEVQAPAMEVPIPSAAKHRRLPLSPPAQTVADNDDLLTEILLRLPIRSFLRFKSVSKRWLSLITAAAASNFTTAPPRPNPKPKPSGLFLNLLLNRHNYPVDPQYDFIPLVDDENPISPPFRALTFVNDRLGIAILQSCNGLFLCSPCSNANYYIYNPTTDQFRALPEPTGVDFKTFLRSFSVNTINLAFDPSKSPHYQVVCVYSSAASPQRFQIEIYSSETGAWRLSRGEPFTVNSSFGRGVFWNGALHWDGLFDSATPYYFNINEERLGTMPRPPAPSPCGVDWGIDYFGESGGHLHLIIETCEMQLDVYEMAIDYSLWFLKYRVDVGCLQIPFPELISDPSRRGFVTLGLIRGEDDDNSFVVLHVADKAIRYNIRDKTFKKLCDFHPIRVDIDNLVNAPWFNIDGWYKAFEFVESLASV